MASAAEQLETFKSFYPNLAHVQALTLDNVNTALEGQPVDWNAVTPANFAPHPEVTISSCQMAVGYVLFDVISLAVGAVGLRSGVSASTVEAMAEAAAPVMSEIETIIAKMGAENASKVDFAWGVFQILKTIYSGSSLGAVFSAFTGSLTWWNMTLYGVTGMATIVAAFATDGLALAAEIVILLANFGFLVTDVVAAVSACSLTPTKAPTGPSPQPGEPYQPSIAIRTFSGNFITVINNGGFDGPNNDTSIIHTCPRVVGTWEKFKLVPLDPSSQTFALQTMNGNYVSATNGGGLGGPSDEQHPIHTDSTKVGPWESLVLIQQIDEAYYAIATTSGYYISATNGGGLDGPNDNSSIIHTSATTIGPWETFSFDSL
jgi:hypothetical protein